MLSLHSTKELDFVCFSNVPAKQFRNDIRVIPLEKDWPAWWSKIECFRPGVDLEKRVLALDIDMLIVGDMNSIIDFDAPVALADYWSYSKFFSTKQAIHRVQKTRHQELIPIYSSDAIVYDKGECDCIYTDFNPAVHIDRYCGDQDWMAVCLGKDRPKFPRNWARKLCKQDRGPDPIDITHKRMIACHPVKNHLLEEMGYTYADRIWKGQVRC